MNTAINLAVQTPLSLKQVGYWQAQLSLKFVQRDGKTLLKDRMHHGPLTVQRPFYPEADKVCHSYLLHPPGGMVGGDKVNVNIELDTAAHALITTPSAGKAYASTGADSVQLQHFTLAEHAVLEWLPQEMIVFEQGKAQLHTKIYLQQNATFIGWDIVCLGRPASGDEFTQGSCVQTLQLYRDGKPLLMDRLNVQGEHINTQDIAGMASYKLLATFIATGADNALLERLQDKVNAFSEGMAGITLIDDVMVCRCLANQSRHAKKLFTDLWAELRPAIINIDAEVPRIWLT